MERQVAGMRLPYQPGDPVVFVVSKVSTDPGPRAHDIHPAPFGDTYQYVVDKYWTVRSVGSDGTLELITRRGKVHHVQPGDPRLRPARWWERWLYRDRFPDLKRLGNIAAPSERSEPRQAVSM
jgi:hypothetical protein